MYPKVIVVWDDAINHGDGHGEPRHRPARQTMIGWLLKSDENGVSLAMEYNEEDSDWREENFIPRGMIVSERVLTGC